jgi:hypothetical protein
MARSIKLSSDKTKLELNFPAPAEMVRCPKWETCDSKKELGGMHCEEHPHLMVCDKTDLPCPACVPVPATKYRVVSLKGNKMLCNNCGGIINSDKADAHAKECWKLVSEPAKPSKDSNLELLQEIFDMACRTYWRTCNDCGSDFHADTCEPCNHYDQCWTQVKIKKLLAQQKEAK